jgi:hypothetical protein
MIRARKLLRVFRCEPVEWIILRLGKIVYRDWTEEALAERLLYLFMPTYRLDGPRFEAAMTRAGFTVEHRQRLPSPSIAKLRHTLIVFRWHR